MKARTATTLGAMIPLVAVTALGQVAQAGTIDEPSLDIYGFVMMDAIYDFNRSHPNWTAALRPSRIPVVCPGDPGCGKDGETTFSVRQTRLGVNSLIPTEIGDLKSKFEFDMFGVGPDEGKTTIRLRHAYGELGQFLAGQTNSLFMDIDVFPNTIEYWGPTGMIFFRNIQARWTFMNQGGTKAAIALEGPGSAIDYGQVPEDLIDIEGVSSRNQFPDLTAQYRMDASWGHFQAAGIVRSIGFDSADESISDSLMGWGLNLSGVINTSEKDKILVQVAYGEGIANYFNDGGADLGPETVSGGAETLPILGFLLYYDKYWSDRWSSSIGYSLTDQDNSEGQSAGSYKRGQYASANLLHYPAKNVMVGGEVIWGARENLNGDSANDSRLQFSAKYNF